ncbi:recombination protein RecR, partial [Candidatus Dojkabacteria bacterium]|nr:recombination protein RecR [Candidatus Dojkabacteria bacterium]
AGRLAVYLATKGRGVGDNLQKLLAGLDDLTICEECGNISQSAKCTICSDDSRGTEQLLIVESPLDLVQFERTGEYAGRYIVLGKLISPVNGVTVRDTNVDLLLDYLKAHKPAEIILGLSSTVEADATAMYVIQQAKNILPDVQITRLARGLASGVSLEYLDTSSLLGALNNRVVAE